MTAQAAKPRDYVSYTTDREFADDYAAYQAKYAKDAKECDKKTANIIAELIAKGLAPRDASILDVGCSTGNFLLLLKRLGIGGKLTGGDLMLPHLEACRANPELSGVDFREVNLLTIPTMPKFDIIVVNAVTYLFNANDFQSACDSLCGALKPGGYFIGYELISPWPTGLTVVETSKWHPNGLTLHLRSAEELRRAMQVAGFGPATVEWFEFPFDLPMPDQSKDDESTCVTYTRKSEDGHRLMFRGALYQPWAHIVAKRTLEGNGQYGDADPHFK